MTVPSSRAARLALDVLLLAMVVIWAGNYSLVKITLRQIPPLPFNAVRLVIASAFFGGGWALSRSLSARVARGEGPRSSTAAIFMTDTAITRQDWLRFAGLGIVGHFCYQLCFINGLSRTTVSNSVLISGCTPVVIALLSAYVGHERIGRAHWVGVLLSLGGLYLVAGRGARLAGTSLVGDLLILLSTGFWAAYTVFSRPLLTRHSPLVVTSATMIIGSLMFAGASLPAMWRLEWGQVDTAAWVAVVCSALFALNVSYLIWYTGVQRLGSARTSVFSNMVPLVALVMAAVWVGERIDGPRIGGAAAILAGVLLTRVRRFGRWNPDKDAPVEG